METFLLFLKESAKKSAGKNVHLEHLEDEIFNGGFSAFMNGLNSLQGVVKSLQSNDTSRYDVSVKWDGCVHEDTVILTNNGDMTIKEIVDHNDLWGKLGIMGKDLNSLPQHNEFSLLLAGNADNGDKSWVEVQLEDGSTIKLTHDHEVHTTHRGWVRAIDLAEGDDITQL